MPAHMSSKTITLIYCTRKSSESCGCLACIDKWLESREKGPSGFSGIAKLQSLISHRVGKAVANQVHTVECLKSGDFFAFENWTRSLKNYKNSLLSVLRKRTSSGGNVRGPFFHDAGQIEVYIVRCSISVSPFLISIF